MSLKTRDPLIGMNPRSTPSLSAECNVRIDIPLCLSSRVALPLCARLLQTKTL